MKNLLFFLFLCAFCSFCKAQTIDFSSAIPLLVNDLGWKNVPLPLSVLEQSYADLSDVRIYGKTAAGDTIEVPYLHKIAQSTEQIEQRTFLILNKSSKANQHFFTFKTDKNVEINQIKLDFAEENFDWKVSLEGGNDNRTWFSILEDYRIFSFANDTEQYAYTDLTFPKSNFSYYRIAIQSAKKPVFLGAKLEYKTRTKGSFVQTTLIPKDVLLKKETKTQTFKLDLKSLYPISEIQFFVGNKFDYFRKIYISYPHIISSKDAIPSIRKGNRRLSSGYLSSLETNSFSFNPFWMFEIEAKIENQDNPPLQIDSVLVRSPKQYLVANFTEKADYFLVFGGRKFQKPTYDIHHFQDKIPTDLDEIDLGELVQYQSNITAENKPLFANKLWLWALMAVIIGVLGWFSLKMLQEK